jgi:hypothetical protein
MTIDFSKQAWSRKRVRVPTVLQMENTECGAACLAMVLAHFKRHVPLERLRVECGVSRDGSNAKNLLQAARSHGMDARGFRLETHELHSLPLPLILYWEFRHFVVLEGRKGDTFFINDPASGPRRIDAEEFDAAFTGVALRLEPAEGFTPSGRGPSLIKGLLKRVAPMKGALFFIIAASILLAAPGLIIPSLARIFVDEVLGPNPQWLVPLVLALAGAAGMTALMTWLQRMAVRSLTIGFLTAGSSAMFHHLLRLPMEFFMQRDAGDIQYRIELNDLVAEMLSGNVGQALTGLFLMVFYAALLFAYDVPLTPCRTGHGRDQPAGPDRGRAAAHGAQSESDAGEVQAHGHDHGRHPAHGDHQGHGFGAGILCPLVRTAGPGQPGRAAHVLFNHPRVRASGAVGRTEHRRGSAVWRMAGDQRGNDHGHARGLPDAHGRLSGPGGSTGPAWRADPGGQGGFGQAG